MNKYQKAKESARNKAVEWQSGFCDKNYSYSELALFYSFSEALWTYERV